MADGVPRVLPTELTKSVAESLAAGTRRFARGGGRRRGTAPVELRCSTQLSPGVGGAPLEPVTLRAAQESARVLQEVVWYVVFKVELEKSPLSPPRVAAE